MAAHAGLAVKETYTVFVIYIYICIYVYITVISLVECICALYSLVAVTLFL